MNENLRDRILDRDDWPAGQPAGRRCSAERKMTRKIAFIAAKKGRDEERERIRQILALGSILVHYLPFVLSHWSVVRCMDSRRYCEILKLR